MNTLRGLVMTGMMAANLCAFAAINNAPELQSPAATLGNNWLVRINTQESNWIDQVRDKCDFRFQTVHIESQSLFLCATSKHG